MRINNAVRSSLKLIRTRFAFFENLSLRKKLFFSYVVVFAIPAVIIGMLFINTLKSSMEKEIIDRCIQEVQHIKINVEKNINVLKSTSQAIITNTQLAAVLGSRLPYTELEILDFQREVMPNIENIFLSNSYIHSVRIYSGSRYIPELYPILWQDVRVKDQAWFKDADALNGRMVWRLNHQIDALLRGTDAESEVVTVYRELLYEHKYAAIVEINMKSDEFYGPFYSNANNDNTFSAILQKDGGMHWNPDSLFARSYLTEAAHLKEMLLEKTQGEDGWFKLRLGKQDLCVAYAYIDIVDSYVYRVISYNTLSNDYRRMMVTGIFYMVSVIIIIILVTYAIAYIMLRKLQTVIGYMRKVQQGQMFIDIPEHGNDEVGELSKHFKVMLDKINELIFTAVRKQALAKEAEINALHSQINAHFIYNVMENIKMLAVLNYNDDIADALTDLGCLMRYNINWKRQYVTLGDEINHITNYLNLLNLRYDNKIRLVMDIPEDSRKTGILKMILQPIVENAVNHGLEPKGVDGEIGVQARATREELIIEIRDNGVGISPERLDQLNSALKEDAVEAMGSSKGHGIGLVNVSKRIRMFYGESYGLTVSSEENVFTAVTVKLPILHDDRKGGQHEESPAG